MPAAIQAVLSQSTVRLRAGEQAELTLTVQNGGMLVATCRVAVLGGEPRWYALSAETLAIWPDDRDEVRIALSVPADAPSGTYDLVVQVVCDDSPDEPARVPLRLEIAGVAGLAVSPPLIPREPPAEAEPPLAEAAVAPAAEAELIVPAGPAVEEEPPSGAEAAPAAGPVVEEGPPPWAEFAPAVEEEPPSGAEAAPAAGPVVEEGPPPWAEFAPAVEEEPPSGVEAVAAAGPAVEEGRDASAQVAVPPAAPPSGEETRPAEGFPWSAEPGAAWLHATAESVERPVEAGRRPPEAPWAIALTLDPPRGSGAGDGSFRVALANRGDIDLTVRPEAADADGGLYYLFEPFRVVVPAGQEQTVELRIRPKSPLGPGEEIRAYSFLVRARLEGGSECAAPAPGVWEQRAPGLELSLRPLRGSGVGDGTFYVHVRNGGAAVVTVRLEASDPEQGCWYALDDVELVVPAGREVSTRLRVRPRAPLAAPGSRTHCFVVTARDSATKASRTVRGEWEQLA